MKILYVIPTLGPGGAEAFVTMLALAMANKGLDVRVYLTVGVRGERGNHLYKILESNGITVIGAKSRSAYSLANIFHLAWIIRTFKPNILHAHLLNAEVLTSLVAKILLMPRNVLFRTLHLTNVVSKNMYFVEMILDKLFGTSIACGPAVELAYKALYNNTFRTRLVTVPNGIQLPDLMPPAEILEFRKNNSIDPSYYVVTSVAGFRGIQLSSSQKAHDTIILAFAAFQKIINNSFLLLVGDGPLLISARDLVRELGISEKVRFVGAVSDSYPFLAISDVFFMPSRFEGLPISLLEAAVSGLPVVASRIPEIVGLNSNYPWYFADVDDIDGFVNCLISARGYNKCFSEDYKKSVAARFDIANCALSYKSCYDFQG